MKRMTSPEKLYLGSGVLALTGAGLSLSMVFAGTGILLLVIASLIFLVGLLVQLTEVPMVRITRWLKGFWASTWGVGKTTAARR
ncbi:MAG: hypothetical protein HYX82_02725 [Chloroflexi bacterium]|nr:hypothetical protein [Chloroflexota bacterium]